MAFDMLRPPPFPLRPRGHRLYPLALARPFESRLSSDLLERQGHPAAAANDPHLDAADRTAVLAMTHRKQRAVATAFAQALGLNVLATTGVDTGG